MLYRTRVPVLNPQGRVHGYVLVQGGESSAKPFPAEGMEDPKLAEMKDLLSVNGGRRGFVDLDQDVLFKPLPTIADANSTVFCLSETALSDSMVIERCRQLKAKGHHLALNVFTHNGFDSERLDVIETARVDFASLGSKDRIDLCNICRERGIAVMAQGLETQDDHKRAHAEGFALYAGRFIEKPSSHLQRTVLSANNLLALRLLKEASQHEPCMKDLAKLIQQDFALSFQLLRLVNSAWFGLRHKVMSIEHALVLMGRREVQRWAAMMAFHAAGSSKSEAVFELALSRAKFCEQLAPLAGLAQQAPELFLLGMLSLVDAIMDRPMAEILTEIALADNIRGALLGGQSDYTPLYEVMTAYEHGQWELFEVLARKICIAPGSIPALFQNSLEWSRQALLFVGGDTDNESSDSGVSSVRMQKA